MSKIEARFVCAKCKKRKSVYHIRTVRNVLGFELRCGDCTHAPGPWELFDCQVRTVEDEFIADCRFGLAAFVNTDRNNAKLCAIAPELLAFAELYLETWPMASNDDPLAVEARRLIQKLNQ